MPKVNLDALSMNSDLLGSQKPIEFERREYQSRLPENIKKSNKLVQQLRRPKSQAKRPNMEMVKVPIFKKPLSIGGPDNLWDRFPVKKKKPPPHLAEQSERSGKHAS